MAHVTLKTDTATMLPLILGVVALILGIIAMFTGWWTMNFSAGGGEIDFTAAPFDQGNFDQGDGDNLGDETLVAGLLMVGVLVSLLAFVVLSIMRMLGTFLHPALPIVALVAALLLGATAIVLAWTTWPSGFDGADALDMGFWDSQSQGGATISTYAGAGWYLAIAGAVLLPAAAAVLALRQGMAQLPASQAPQPMIVPSPLPTSALSRPMAPAAAPRRLEMPEPTPALDSLGSPPVRKTAVRKAPAAKAKKPPVKVSKK